MFTIITIPKAFQNSHISTIQKNAIKSWTEIIPRPEIILFGDDYGVDTIAAEFGVRHIKEVSKTQLGTPLLSSVFDIAGKEASNDIICYVNADIVFFHDIVQSIQSVPFDEFLILGQRWDYDQLTLIDFDSNFSYNEYFNTVKENGSLHPPAGSDYFIYKKSSLQTIPEFAVGRAGWDNWFISYFYKKKIAIIDASKSITAIHQNHDYAHVKEGVGNSYRGTESSQNLSFISRNEELYTIIDSSHCIKNGVVKKVFGIKYFFQRIKRNRIVFMLFMFAKKIKKFLFKKEVIHS